MGGGQPTIDCNVLAVNVATFIYSFMSERGIGVNQSNLPDPRKSATLAISGVVRMSGFFLTY